MPVPALWKSYFINFAALCFLSQIFFFPKQRDDFASHDAYSNWIKTSIVGGGCHIFQPSLKFWQHMQIKVNIKARRRPPLGALQSIPLQCRWFIIAVRFLSHLTKQSLIWYSLLWIAEVMNHIIGIILGIKNMFLFVFEFEYSYSWVSWLWT